jgi:hypothetical protein
MSVLPLEPAICNLAIQIGDDFIEELEFNETDDDGVETPIDFTGYTFEMQIRQNIDSTTTIATTPTDITVAMTATTNIIKITILDTFTTTLSPSSAVYDLRWTDTSSNKRTFLKGTVDFVKTVTRP